MALFPIIDLNDYFILFLDMWDIRKTSQINKSNYDFISKIPIYQEMIVIGAHVNPAYPVSEICFRYGLLCVFEQLYTDCPRKYAIYPDLAMINGHVHMLDWLKANDIWFNHLPTNTELGKIARRGYLSMLKWLKKYLCFFDITTIINNAALCSQFPILDWVKELNIEHINLRVAITTAIYNGNIPVLDWFYNSGWPFVYDSSWEFEYFFWAIKNNKHDVIVWFKSHNLAFGQ